MAAMFYGEWHSPDGILTVGTDEDPLKDSDVKRYKGILNYGLLVAYKRNPSNKPFRDLVRSYINVQFNALYELARHGNYYAIDWRGPNIERKFHSQLAALTTMVSALTVNIDDEGDDQIDYNRDPW
ncbi:hypothetical protein FRC03_011717 [Tulasnella sp. 419]|nr:hypothetical protein FRC03_011717 [Tulasnella sp. 419]